MHVQSSSAKDTYCGRSQFISHHSGSAVNGIYHLSGTKFGPSAAEQGSNCPFPTPFLYTSRWAMLQLLFCQPQPALGVCDLFRDCFHFFLFGLLAGTWNRPSSSKFLLRPFCGGGFRIQLQPQRVGLRHPDDPSGQHPLPPHLDFLSAAGADVAPTHVLHNQRLEGWKQNKGYEQSLYCGMGVFFGGVRCKP